MAMTLENPLEILSNAAIMALPIEERSELFTVYDLEKLPESNLFRYELIKGEIIVSTAPRYIHQLIVSKLVGEIRIYLKQNPIGDVVAGPGLIFGVYDAVIPDVIFISNQRRDDILQAEDDKLHGAPELAIEIVSPGKANARRDRLQKLELYNQFGVSEYWVIAPRSSAAEIYRRAKKGLKLAQNLTENDELTTPILPGFVCQLKSLF